MQNLSTKLSIFIAMIIAFTSCSVNKNQQKKEFIEPSEVAFLEYYQTQEGEVIKGTAPQGRRIDGPTYKFDSETKQLDIFRKENLLLDTVKVILGNGIILKGSSGSGLSMRITAIGKLPYTMNKLTITEVSSNGIRLLFDKKELLLKEGEEWQTSTSSTDTIKSESKAVVKTNTTYTIHYFGKISKGLIKN